MDRYVLPRLREAPPARGVSWSEGEAKTMKKLAVTAGVLAVLVTGSWQAFALLVFGPKKFEVQERYGKDNIYQETFRTAGGPHMIKVRNWTQRSERPDILEMSMNGTKLFGPDWYEYPLYVCFLSLNRENTIELNLRDQKPSGMRRPFLGEKFVIVSIEPAPVRFPEGLYGLESWERMKDLQGAIQRVKDGDSRSRAFTALDLRQPAALRIEAVHALGEEKDPRSKDYFLFLYRDRYAVPALRGEAAAALGMLRDAAMVPQLLDGLFQPFEEVREGAARALALYPEQETSRELTRRLERVDPLRKSAIIRSIVKAGWRPIGAIEEMAGSPDPHVAAVAIELLGTMKEQRATDLLLSLLQEQGPQNRNDIIRALGVAGDARAVEPLLALARDPARRKGLEASLGTALAGSGDRRAETAIQEMADT
ncbi:MAG TPA: HEAT repeat domain-containing protein, partial [Nitrospirota bacterium]|nr:HEAT repeat domain-containing protein [Nitrospirota bacterium]